MTPTPAVSRQLQAEDIDWDSDPEPDTEEDPLLAAVVEAEAYRAIAIAALDHAHDLYRQLATRDATIARLRDEHRQLQAVRMAGGAAA